MNKETKAENLHVSPADGKPPVSGWRMFEATVVLKDGTKRTFISSTLGGEEEAKNAAINNDWSSPAVDAVIAFR